MIKDDNVTDYTFNELDQLVSEKTTSENEVISDKTYTYDANGNQTRSKASVTGDATEMEYNEIDMTTGLRMEENGRVMLEQENVYTNLGQRIKKTDTKYTYEDGETEGAAESEARRYLYANGSLVGTADDEGNLTTFNILTPEGSIISSSRIEENSEEKWYLYNKDDLGSTTSIIGEDGKLAAAYEYDEYGNTTYLAGEDFDNEICYTGQIFDKNTGLYYYNARFYDPESGTFTTQDTYRGEQINPLTQNLYAYCAGDVLFIEGS